MNYVIATIMYLALFLAGTAGLVSVLGEVWWDRYEKKFASPSLSKITATLALVGLYVFVAIALALLAYSMAGG